MARMREIVALQKYLVRSGEEIIRLLNKRKAIYKKAESDLTLECEEVIDLFYASYPERNYSPTGSLYKAFKVTINDDMWVVDYDPSFMNGFDHHQSNEIIFNNVFEEGYHGGSYATKTTIFPPSNETPYYRKPPGLFVLWGDPAVRTFSPYEQMKRVAEESFNKLSKELDKEIFDDVLRILDERDKRILELKIVEVIDNG